MVSLVRWIAIASLAITLLGAGVVGAGGCKGKAATPAAGDGGGAPASAGGGSATSESAKLAKKAAALKEAGQQKKWTEGKAGG